MATEKTRAQVQSAKADSPTGLIRNEDWQNFAESVNFVNAQVVGTSLDVGSGAIGGGAITGAAIVGTSLSAGSGTIGGGVITGTSLSAGSGAIGGGAITGTSLNVGSGAIDGGAITGAAIVGTSLSAGSGTIGGGATTVTTIGGTDLTLTGFATIGASSILGWTGRSELSSSVDGTITLTNDAGTDFDFLRLGGSTSSFPSLERDGALVALRLADDTGPTAILCSREIDARSSTGSVTADDCNKVITNEGATSSITISLPTAAAGYSYTFIVQDTDGLTVDAATGDTIRVADEVSASSGNVASITIGSSVTLAAINASEWIATSVTGVWTVT